MSHESDDDDDNYKLPADTLGALQEFYKEKDTRQKQFEELKTAAEDDYAQLSIHTLFAEDWNASQFWYTDATAETLARALLTSSTPDSSIAIVSAPSVYIALKNLLRDTPASSRPSIRLLEYDTRFSVFASEFTLYDFAHPLRLPEDLKGRFDRIIVDPPFLSEDCQTKSALTVRWLAKGWGLPVAEGGLRLVSCTGERMGELILRLYGGAGVRGTGFKVEHAKGLSNEFRCFANFEGDEWSLV